MIKLVTQFDNEKTKMSLATPTCGCCCCCCCCCIASTFTTASITARSFGDYVQKKLPDEPKKIKSARNIGYWYPLGLAVLLLICLAFIDDLDNMAIIVIPAISLIYIFMIGIILYNKTKLRGIIGLLFGSLLFFVGMEVAGFYLGLFSIVYLNVFYGILVVVISISMTMWAFKKNYDKIDTNNEIGEEKKIDSGEESFSGESKVCLNCGSANDINNKYCVSCSTKFDMDEKK